MKLNIILCLAALFLVSCTLPIITEGDAPKVKVDFYFESLCPYCQQYIVGSLKKAAATKVTLSLDFRASGISVNLISIPMEMQEDKK